MKYRVLQYVGPFTAGQVVSSEEFPAGADFDRLIRIGAIEVLATPMEAAPVSVERTSPRGRAEKASAQPRVYSRDFKVRLCEQIIRREATRYRVCLDHTLSRGMLDRWLTQYILYGENAFRGQVASRVAAD